MTFLYTLVSQIVWPFAILWAVGMLSGTVIEYNISHWFAAFIVRLAIRFPTIDEIKKAWKRIKEEK